MALYCMLLPVVKKESIAGIFCGCDAAELQVILPVV
jgi:hypothetical protein